MVTAMLWDEEVARDVRLPSEVSPENFGDAMRKAREAFWAAIGAAFPQVETGDLPPGADIAFEWASNDLVLNWLRYNYPIEEGA